MPAASTQSELNASADQDKGLKKEAKILTSRCQPGRENPQRRGGRFTTNVSTEHGQNLRGSISVVQGLQEE